MERYQDIRIREFLLVESGILGFEIRNPTNDWNPEFKFHWKKLESITWNPESTAWTPESKTDLDFLIWGDTKHFKMCITYIFSWCIDV